MIYAEGNHEANAVNFFSQIALPGDQQNYGTDYGYAHVTVANDSPAAARRSRRRDQRCDRERLRGERERAVEDLDAPPADVLGVDDARLEHHAAAAVAAARRSIRIDLVLNGHDHDYEVSFPLLGQAVQATNATGTVYVVAGGAGAELYQNGQGFWTDYSESTYSAATIDVRRDQMTMDAFRQDGTAIPTGFSKSKQ